MQIWPYKDDKDIYVNMRYDILMETQQKIIDSSILAGGNWDIKYVRDREPSISGMISGILSFKSGPLFNWLIYRLN